MSEKNNPVDTSGLQKLRDKLIENCQIESALFRLSSTPEIGHPVTDGRVCKGITIPSDMTQEKADSYNKSLRRNLKDMGDALRVSKA